MVPHLLSVVVSGFRLNKLGSDNLSDVPLLRLFSLRGKRDDPTDFIFSPTPGER